MSVACNQPEDALGGRGICECLYRVAKLPTDGLFSMPEYLRCPWAVGTFLGQQLFMISPMTSSYTSAYKRPFSHDAVARLCEDIVEDDDV